MFHFTLSRTTLGVAALLMCSAAYAQTAPPEDARADTDAIVTYDRTYFAQFNAITAEDLIKRIPGAQEFLTPQTSTSGTATTTTARGFGSSGIPILFNGRRFSGKTNDARAALGRVQAAQVVRIEIIRGTVPGLDIRVGAEGAVINVVMEEELTSAAGSWEANLSYFTSGRWRPGGRVSYSATSGPLSYMATVTMAPVFTRRYTRDDFFRPQSFDAANQPLNFQPSGRLRLIDQNGGTDYTFTGSAGYAFANGGIGNLNGRYSHEEKLLRQPIDNFSLVNNVEVYTGSALQLRDTKGDIEWEIGGDYEYPLANGDTMRLLFVVTDDRRPNNALFYNSDVARPENFIRRQILKSTRTEKIGRGQYRWEIAPGHSLEFGGEAALNGIDQRISRIVGAVPDILPIPDSNVDETRFETFLSYGWQANPGLFVESALDGEYSRLKQKGSAIVTTTRTFKFLKPRLDIRYDLMERTQVRARVLRTISQLDFANFVTSFVTDDRRLGELLIGNPNLVPEKAWVFEGTIERRLAADRGLISLRGFYNRITDYIDKFPITPAVAGTGNTGKAWLMGAEAKLGLRLDSFGLSRATVDATGLIQDSSVTDAFTFDKRNFVSYPKNKWTVSYRQDLDWNSLAYGVTFTGQGAFIGSDIDYRHTFHFAPDTEAFVEMRAAGLTFRLEAARLTRDVRRERFQYTGNRALNPRTVRLEERYDTFAKVIKGSIKGTF